MKKKRQQISSGFFAIIVVVAASVILTLSSSGCLCKGKKTQKSRIKLVLMIVIDQLRADSVEQLVRTDRLGVGGFNYLIDSGTWYKNARFRHCTTLTACGHATLFTGGTPAEHGIIGNYWFQREGMERIQVRSVDASPVQLTSTTIGDQLVLHTNGKSRVFSVSHKDRGAVLPGGYLGKAFWYDYANGRFRSSPYYYKGGKFPQWLTDWNGQKKADAFRDSQWELMNEKSTYIYAKNDDRPEEMKYNKIYNRQPAFPHSLKKHKNNEFYRQLVCTPFGDELLLDFAIHMVKSEKIGQTDATDMLTISFSVTDIIGHAYGPCSLEYEDNLLRLDATLATLFTFIDETVGLKHTLMVLASDHGTDLIPEYRKRLNMPAGRLYPDELVLRVNQALQSKYNSQKDFVKGFRNPSIYLQLPVIDELGLDISEVEAVAADAVMKLPGIAYAASRSDLMKGKVSPIPQLESLNVVFHPKRSGNILILQEPFYFMYHVVDDDSAMHGSPYTYDTHVPVIFCGPGIGKQVVYRAMSPGDIAPTVASILGIAAPSGSSGKPLTEVLQ